MKLQYLFLCLLWSLSNPALAQTAVIQVTDSETEEDLKDVVIHSRLELNQDSHLKTDFLGRIEIHIAQEDTISFEREGYYPVHIVIHSHEEYDFYHPIHVRMTPLAHHTHIRSIQDFEDMHTYDYHFTNPEEDFDNHFKVTVLEHIHARSKREEWLATTRDRYNNDFNVIVIGLKK